MSYPPLPSNGETQWGNKFISWADALEGRKVEGNGMSLRRDTTFGERILLDHPWGTTMLYGDTGWRSIPVPTDIPGVEPGGSTPLQVRRVGSVVNAFIDRLTFTAEYVTGTLVVPIDTGFRPTTPYMPHAGYPSGNSRSWIWLSSGLAAHSGATIIDGRWSWTFTTTQPWPTTLTGTPA